jgi:hypothetical protein
MHRRQKSFANGEIFHSLFLSRRPDESFSFDEAFFSLHQPVKDQG